MKYFSILFFIFLITFCTASPEIILQKQTHQPQEIILGYINDSLTKLTRDNLHIFDGRKEVFFEKDMINFNGTYYFYITPPKEGNFSLKINNILYNESGNLLSKNLEANLNVAKTGNKTIAINPGVYYGTNPIFYITNIGKEPVEINLQDNKFTLNVSEMKKISPPLVPGFNVIDLKTYDDFKFYFYYLSDSNQNSSENVSGNISTKIKSINATANLTINQVKNQTENYSIFLNNTGNTDLENLSYKTNLKGITLVFSPLSAGENKTFNLYYTSDEIGFYFGNISIYDSGEFLQNISLSSYIFTDNSSLNSFNKTSSSKTCSSLNGTICKIDEDCIGDFVGSSEGLCCFGVCKNQNQTQSRNSSSIWLGIILVLIVAGIIYFFYKRYKNVKSPNARQKFGDIEDRYKQGVLGK